LHPIFIDGAWREAGAGVARPICNPATLEALGTVADCGADDIARAVAAATAALPLWQALSANERGALLIQLGGRTRARARPLAQLLMRETGKPWCEALECVEAAAGSFEACAREQPDEGTPRAGVLAALLPFHFPLLSLARTLGSALAAGHTVIAKPAEENPLASLLWSETCAALPPGVVNVITGGMDSARALAMHPQVGHVVFSGSAREGDLIATAARGRRVSIHTGEVDAVIVCADAPLDLAVPEIAWSRLVHGGQGRASHLYVERPIVADFIERLHQCVGFLDVDDPAKLPTDLGPLISAAAARRVEAQVGETLRDGATLILGGRRFRPSGLPGHFFQPTILANVRAGALPARQEILGPVLTITPIVDAAEGLCVAWSCAAGRVDCYNADGARAQAVVAAAGGRAFEQDPTLAELFAESSLTAHDADAPPRQVRLHLARVRKPWWFPYHVRAATGSAGAAHPSLGARG
jgi:acyl-CoA reductase-like NAD-dependent aldehyde dehydrogenase